MTKKPWIDCPECNGTGDDPDGCGCQCTTPEEEAACTSMGCIHCNCAGCSGSCDWCGGSGYKNDWEPGNPPYEKEQSPDQGDFILSFIPPYAPAQCPLALPFLPLPVFASRLQPTP